MGTGFNDTVFAIAVDGNGDVYAGGKFTTNSSGGTSLKRLAKFASGASDWSTVGGGTGGGFSAGQVNTILFDNTGNLFVGGTFAATTDGTTVNGAARKLSTGSTLIVAVGEMPVSADVKTIEVGPDNAIYWGGTFTTSNGAVNICKTAEGLTTAILLQDGLNLGLDNTVYKIKYDRISGLFYIAGQYAHTAIAFGTGTTMRRICTWNGSTYAEVGNGLDATSKHMVIDSDGNIILDSISGTYPGNGTFTQSQDLVKYNGVYWNQLDIELVSRPIDAMELSSNGYLIIAPSTSNTQVLINAHTTVTNNGNATASVTFKLVGVGTLRFIKNETTGQQIDLNYAMISNEIIYLTLSVNGISAISSVYGNIINSIFIDDFNPTPFYINPGDNDIAMFIYGVSGAADARIIYRDTFYSAD
jgi:hypothetical protein